MPTDDAVAQGLPNINHAAAWLTDVAVQLQQAAVRHDDGSLHDLAATVRDVARRGLPDPRRPPTLAQLLALHRLLADSRPVTVCRQPDGRLTVTAQDGPTAVVAPTGAVTEGR